MDWHDYILAQQQHADRIQLAQELRVIRSLTNKPTNAFYAPALARLGRWLIAWGWRLRARYSNVEFEVRPEIRHDWSR